MVDCVVHHVGIFVSRILWIIRQTGASCGMYFLVGRLPFCSGSSSHQHTSFSPSLCPFPYLITSSVFAPLSTCGCGKSGPLATTDVLSEKLEEQEGKEETERCHGRNYLNKFVIAIHWVCNYSDLCGLLPWSEGSTTCTCTTLVQCT